MSNYDPIDIDTGKPIDHHHGGHHWYHKHSGKFWWAFVCCVLVVLFLILLFWGLSYSYCNETYYHVHELKNQINSQNKQFSSQGLYSIAGAISSKSEYNLCLSHMAPYHTVNMGGGGSGGNNTGTNVILLEKTDTSKYEENRGVKNYVVKLLFNVRYNVAPKNLGYDVEKLGIRPDERYMVVHFEVVSKYPQFSSIRFVESTIDTYRDIITTRRIITICSNEMSGSARSCGRYATMENMLIMNNTRIFPMDHVPSHIKNKTGSGGGTIRPKNDPDEDEDMDEDYDGYGEDDNGDIEHDNTQDSRNKLIDEISHTRLFHILFYKESGNNEYISLSIEPTQCGVN
jgi:hypothetical protein